MTIRCKLVLLRFLRWLYAKFTPPPTPRETDLVSAVRTLSTALADAQAREDRGDVDYLERVAELLEARQMAGVGPWRMSPETIRQTDALITAAVDSYRTGIPLREALRVREGFGSVGAYGDIELALQNIEWRRQVNLSFLEFSRWGIQQIILISRLYFIKNPLIQRGVNIAAAYVFGRGFEVSSDDEAANDTLTEFLERNKKTLGQIGLTNLQRRLYYDGQVFFCIFADKQNSGEVNVRTIDAAEIQDIRTNPDDTDEPRYYKRQWSQRTTLASGQLQTQTVEAWYPAIDYEPTGAERFDRIEGVAVRWDEPVLHMRGGAGVSKWHFDVPLVYAALDWAKASVKLLEACATVRRKLAQIAMTITTKGGQQAIAGIKQQLETTVSAQPGNSLWDTNPVPVNASTFASGPGTELKAFSTQGAGGDPEDVRRFIHMVAMVFGLPETFFADAKNGSLATAQSLDRPTELYFLEMQERWRETLVTIAKYVLRMSAGAANGRLRASMTSRGIGDVLITEAKRIEKTGRMVYAEAFQSTHPIRDAKGTTSASLAKVNVRVTFPAIREGDLPALVKAIVDAMTLDNKGGQVVGIDEKIGVGLLMEQLGVEDPEEVLETMYPKVSYDPDRTKVPLPEPIPKNFPAPGGTIPATQEARKLSSQLQGALRRLESAVKLAEENGHSSELQPR